MGHPVAVFENQALPTPDAIGTFQECVRNPTHRKETGLLLGARGEGDRTSQ